MEHACASSCDLQFLTAEAIPKMKTAALRYLLDYQQLEEEWIPASMKKPDLVAAVQELKDRGPLTAAQIYERFGPEPEDHSGTELEDEEGEAEPEDEEGEAEPEDEEGEAEPEDEEGEAEPEDEEGEAEPEDDSLLLSLLLRLLLSCYLLQLEMQRRRGCYRGSILG